MDNSNRNFAMQNRTRIIWSAFCALSLVLAVTGFVDYFGKEYTESGFKRALITFGVARGLNAVISVAQGTEIALQPAGVGLNLTPGQILDPINDLIERFSYVMLVSSVSLGMQKMLLSMTSSAAFTIIITVISGGLLIALWSTKLANNRLRVWLIKGVFILIVLRFCIPSIAIVNEVIYTMFLQEQYMDSRTQLEETTKNIDKINLTDEQIANNKNDPSIFGQAKRLYDSATSSFNLDKKLEQYKNAATHASEHAINLIVIFCLQTIFFPLFFLWVVVSLIKKIGSAPFKMVR